jgi:DNA polymerase-4
MQRKDRAGRTVVLRLRLSDYTRTTRSCTLGYATGDLGPIAAASQELLDAAMPLIERRGVTLVGLTVTNLDTASGVHQLALPLFDESEPGRRA